MSIIYQKFCVPRNSYNWIIALVCQANHKKTPARPTLKVFEDKVLHLHCNVICKRLACLFFSDKDESRVGPVLQSPFLWNSVRRTLKDPRTARKEQGYSPLCGGLSQIRFYIKEDLYNHN